MQIIHYIVYVTKRSAEEIKSDNQFNDLLELQRGKKYLRENDFYLFYYRF